MMKMDKGLLPIGTVVLLKGATKRLMIVGFCAADKAENMRNKKIWDYSGCIYPEGFLDSRMSCLFDHDQIQEICHLGLANDDEEKAFKEKLNEITQSL